MQTWDIDDSDDDIDGRIDEDHKKMVQTFCRSAYLDEIPDKAERTKVLKKQVRAINDNQYKTVLNHFGEERMILD